MTKIERQIHKIDATGQTAGRLATKIAVFLRGKNKPEFVPHIDNGGIVHVENASKLKFSGKKLEQREYYHYSGYPGGLKTTKIKNLFDKNPAEILKKAVYKMLPKNKLQAKMIQRLYIKN